MDTAMTTKRCTCERPLPTERAAEKGKSETVCGRCGLPLSLTLTRPPQWAA
jgi:hypothetical protein